MNCNWNRLFPKPPSGGWYKADNWFSRIDDLVRSLLVCRYIDGPEKVCREAQKVAEDCGLDAAYIPRATNQGYYAYHARVVVPVDLFGAHGPATTSMQIEIQVTTQLQEILRDLTHTYYRSRRISPGLIQAADNWDYTSINFRGSYLGHTLHLIEGMIAEL